MNKTAINNKSNKTLYLLSISRILLTLGFLLLFFLMLKFPSHSLYYAFTGLTLWFQKMIPVLFPFMILSGIMIRMNLTDYFSIVLSPLLKPLFRVSGNGSYCIIMGFFCGFPMGAKVIADLYERQKLSKGEANYLLSFCNNIGPIYFTSFVLPLLELPVCATYLFGMYGIPILYGFLLCRLPFFHFKVSTLQTKLPVQPESSSILAHIDDSILTTIESITKLGGYMILFNLLNLIPGLFLPESILPICNTLLEITSGLSRMGNSMPYLVLILLPFGGLSCIAQTYSIIKNTDLSIGNYFIHKCILTFITALYYLGIYFLF